MTNQEKLIKNVIDYIGKEHGIFADYTEPACMACGYFKESWWTKGKGLLNWKLSGLQSCHIIPASLGGSVHYTNIVYLCESCHYEAPDVIDKKFMIAWIRERGHYLVTELNNPVCNL